MFIRGATNIDLFESTIRFQLEPGFYLICQRGIFINTLEKQEQVKPMDGGNDHLRPNLSN